MQLWEHQRRIIEFIKSRKTVLVDSGMTTGKTLAALVFIKENIQGRALIICPKSVGSVWEDDNQTFNLGLNIIDATRLSNAKATKALEAMSGHAVYVVNYEKARRLPLDTCNFEVVVCDEAHALGGHNSLQSKQLAKLCKDIPIKVCMTGTPHEDGLHKLYGIFRFLQPERGVSKLFGSWNRFLDDFCTTYTNGYVRIISGYKNTEHLKEVISPYTITIRTEDVVDLPDLILRVQAYTLAGPALKYYKEIEKTSVIDDLDILISNQLEQLLRLRQLTSCGRLPDGSSVQGLENKLALFKEVIAEAGNEPVVIFTSFEDDIPLIETILPSAPAYLTGSRNNLDEWQAGKFQYLIANLEAGSVGVRLERASIGVFWSFNYRASSYEQAIFRLRRKGQKSNTVRFVQLIAEGTVEEDVMEIIHKKLTSSKEFRECT